MKQHVYEHEFIISSSFFSLHASISVVPNFYRMLFSYPIEFLHLLPMKLFTCGMFQMGIFGTFQHKRSIFAVCFPARLIKSWGGVPGYCSCDRLWTLWRLTYVHVAHLQVFPARVAAYAACIAVDVIKLRTLDAHLWVALYIHRCWTQAL